MNAHLRPTAALAADAILPGDPKRAMDLATTVMERPLMTNLSRGLWGYTGLSAKGRELTVQSTGIGGPSAAVVVAELSRLGVRRAIRIGTCIALDPAIALGQALIVTDAIPADGVGGTLATDETEPPDTGLTTALASTVSDARSGRVASTDLYYDLVAAQRRDWRQAGALAFEMSAAATFAVARRSGVEAACGLVVAETAAGERLSDEALDAAALALGRRAAVALEAQAPASLP